MHTKRLRNLKNVHFEIDFRICWKFFVKVGNRGDGGGTWEYSITYYNLRCYSLKLYFLDISLALKTTKT